jgi:hypothetical protein
MKGSARTASVTFDDWHVNRKRDAKDMPLPPDVEEAKCRMDKADAALRADIESTGPVDRARRLELIDELQMAAD